ncbi:MAG: hypothetical protein U0269_25905 [Polyangiales bacterium]
MADKLNTILELHAGEVQSIPGSTYFGVASRLGVVGRVGEEDIAVVARELRLDSVLIADVTRNGRRLGLRIRVARGRDGAIIGTVNMEVGRVDDLDAIEPDLWQELSRHIRDAAGRRTTGGANNAGSNGNASANSQVGDGSNNNGGNGEPSGPTPTDSVRALPGLGFLQLALHAGWSARSWRMPILGERSPRGYENGGFFEGGLNVRAMWRGQHDRLGIGAFAYGVLPLVISSRGTTPENQVVALPTMAFDVGGGFTVAYLPPGGGSFRGDLGFSYHSFDVNTMRLPVQAQVVRMAYIGGRARAEGSVPLLANGSIELGLLFAGELRVVSVGSEARAAYGENAPISYGFGGGGGMELRFDGAVPGLAVRGTGEFLRYRTTFAGRADVGTGSDSVDDYLRVHVAVSYAFGVKTPARNNAASQSSSTGSTPASGN